MVQYIFKKKITISQLMKHVPAQIFQQEVIIIGKGKYNKGNFKKENYLEEKGREKC